MARGGRDQEREIQPCSFLEPALFLHRVCLHRGVFGCAAPSIQPSPAASGLAMPEKHCHLIRLQKWLRETMIYHGPENRAIPGGFC